MNKTLRGREPGTDEIVGETPETGSETDVGNPERPANAEAEMRAKIREQAMAETRAHFEKESGNAEAWLATPGNVEVMIDVLVDLSALERPISEASLQSFSREHGLPSGISDLLPAISKSLDALRPIRDMAAAKEGLKKFIREKLDPSARLADAASKYDAGTSWYHTTPEGRSTLERISGDAKDSANKE